MMNNKFNKYRLLGADYHYQQLKVWNFLKFNAYLAGRYRLIVNEIVKRVDLKILHGKNFNVIDIGCGDGVLISLLKKEIIIDNIKFFGIDLSPTAIKIAQKKIPSATFIKAGIDSLPFGDSYFDLIVSTDVIEHLIEPKILLNEIRRIAKPNAYIFVGTPIKITDKPIDEMHYREFFPTEFKKLMQAKYGNVILVQSHPLLYYLLYRLKMNIFGHIFTPIRYLINLYVLIFRNNIFIGNNEEQESIYTYMYAISRNEK